MLVFQMTVQIKIMGSLLFSEKAAMNSLEFHFEVTSGLSYLP